MQIAILGGGFTGLTAAYYLAKKGHKVTLFEKEEILGGLASGFKDEKWSWYLERTYHHLFSNDMDILNFAKEVGFNDVVFESPETASLYPMFDSRSSKIEYRKSNSRIFPLDTPQDFLKFPLLSWPSKIRAAFILAFLKFSPFFNLYEKQTAEEFLKKTMGDEAWNVLWQELFRKKFGKYAGIILTSFFWARIKKRTKDLGYIKGGFQTFINYLEKVNQDLGVVIKKGCQIGEILIHDSRFMIHEEKYDAVISTLPTPVLVKLAENIFPENYLSNLKKIKYLHATTLILQSEKPLLEKTYWLNVCDKNIPIMGLVQHTNFMNKKYYNDKHILYVANYLDGDDKRLKMDGEEAVKFYLPYLKQINPQYSERITQNFFFKAPWAQPIYDKEFVANKPTFETPVKNFFIANLDMTYPYDRGTNYAVKLGKEVSRSF
ncbi:MAG: FAD-dependent oxidoreductase [Candidatus Roizmanbacteria bacterium]|nr:MAG: FAD-dependent oxidoreductase [Candidatus Roizmanbacteria bacterium]